MATECHITPLTCGAYNIEVKGGIAPALLTNRGTVLVSLPEAATQSALLKPLFPLVSAHCLYKLPATFGIKVGYAITNNCETYLEFNYIHAGPAAPVTHNFTIPNTDNTLNIYTRASSFSACAGYWGGRYYWDRYWNCIAFFVGGKIGIAHTRPVCLGGAISYSFLPVGTKLPAATHYLATNTVSGGAHIGFDAHIWRCLSCVLTAEIVAFGQLRGNHDIVFPTAINSSNHAVAAAFGSLVFFPITLGFRWEF
jgi:hypothetical protein